jgi:hypothetical protein
LCRHAVSIISRNREDGGSQIPDSRSHRVDHESEALPGITEEFDGLCLAARAIVLARVLAGEENGSNSIELQVDRGSVPGDGPGTD